MVIISQLDMREWLMLGAFLMLTGCSEPPFFSHNKDEAKQQLLMLAPVGSDARKAKPVLESKGFKCHWVPNNGFAGVEGKHDFLYCDLTLTIGFMMTRRWQLALVHKNFVVTNAGVGISLTGL